MADPSREQGRTPFGSLWPPQGRPTACAILCCSFRAPQVDLSEIGQRSTPHNKPPQSSRAKAPFMANAALVVANEA
eukprot:11414391-Alexandrium_andersonii.AAC.1